jgi:hypothetical protein
MDDASARDSIAHYKSGTSDEGAITLVKSQE